MKIKSKIKKLKLGQILDLYYLLSPVLPDDFSGQPIKVFRKILERIFEKDVEIFYVGMDILTGLDRFEVVDLGEMQALNLFVDSLSKNDFFDFVDFLRTLTQDD